eukprot:CAMPEP_0170285092 /NCGR_PEP_ID=MMETSP0116_2-20130129/42591_1 /TAXON_ID=400756 /ORGANISM="Durinskia baltica, Strain CSIRO CS-38" /LENGTH=318 /DNA_ID=CAMNT_0010536485 /DNA_START=170 /DNA_END=1122 /DNA_ORIENTATION=+
MRGGMSPSHLRPGFIVKNTFIDVDEPWDEGDEGCPSPHRRNASAPPSPSRARRNGDAEVWDLEEDDQDCGEVPPPMSLGRSAFVCRREGTELAQTLLQRQGDSCEAWSPPDSPKKAAAKGADLVSIFDGSQGGGRAGQSDQRVRGLREVFCGASAWPAPADPPRNARMGMPMQHADLGTPSPPQGRPCVPAAVWSPPECPPPPSWNAGGEEWRSYEAAFDESFLVGTPMFQQGEYGAIAQSASQDQSPDFSHLPAQQRNALLCARSGPVQKPLGFASGAHAVVAPRSAPSGGPPGVFLARPPTGPREEGGRGPPRAPR